MRCERVQELLKSDYLDGRSAEQEMLDVAGHLKQCAQCRQMEEKLLLARQSFKDSLEQQVSERVWQNIRSAIVVERLKQEEAKEGSIWQRLRGLIWAPRPVFALASAVTVIIFAVIFTGVIMKNKQSINSIDSAQIASEYHINGINELAGGFGTSIEEYFL